MSFVGQSPNPVRSMGRLRCGTSVKCHEKVFFENYLHARNSFMIEIDICRAYINIRNVKIKVASFTENIYENSRKSTQ